MSSRTADRQANSLLQDARLRRVSPSGSGRPLSRQELAEAVNAYLWDRCGRRAELDANYVGKLERGEFRWPQKLYRDAFRAVLDADKDADLGFFITRSGQRNDTQTPAPDGAERRTGPSTGAGDPIESPSMILARIQQQSASETSTAVLGTLDLFIDDIIERYEHEGPSALAPQVIEQRHWVQPLLHQWTRPAQHERLTKIAARLSGQLCYMAVNLGRFSSARAYGIEAFELANHIDDTDLQAWVRGTQSLTEFYAGDYQKALDFARDGRRFAGHGRQAVRLAINGEARALGQLGDSRAVDQAVGEAFTLLERFPAEPGMTPCISFGVYSEARVAANAATAYLPFKHPPRVLQQVERAREIVDASPSVWSQALTRLDTATALLNTASPDLEHATTVTRDAMRIAGRHRIESIEQRTRALLASFTPWSTHPTVRDLLQEAETWMSKERSR